MCLHSTMFTLHAHMNKITFVLYYSGDSRERQTFPSQFWESDIFFHVACSLVPHLLFEYSDGNTKRLRSTGYIHKVLLLHSLMVCHKRPQEVILDIFWKLSRWKYNGGSDVFFFYCWVSFIFTFLMCSCTLLSFIHSHISDFIIPLLFLYLHPPFAVPLLHIKL